jgi:hypothetical protein
MYDAVRFASAILESKDASVALREWDLCGKRGGHRCAACSFVENAVDDFGRDRVSGLFDRCALGGRYRLEERGGAHKPVLGNLAPSCSSRGPIVQRARAPGASRTPVGEGCAPFAGAPVNRKPANMIAMPNSSPT